MIKLTEEQYEALLYNVKDLLHDAYYSQFLRGVNTQSFDLVKNIYLSLTNSKEELKINCSSCVINLFSKVGKLFFQYEKDRTEQLELEAAKFLEDEIKKAEAEKAKNDSTIKAKEANTKVEQKPKRKYTRKNGKTTSTKTKSKKTN